MTGRRMSTGRWDRGLGQSSSEAPFFDGTAFAGSCTGVDCFGASAGLSVSS